MRTFISYSHKDKKWYEMLKIQLKSLEREKLIEPWSDYEILPGSNIDDNIKHKMEQSELFLLLISPDFIASDYCIDKELEHAIERHNSDTAIVVPIIVRFCNWESVNAISRLKALPNDAKPVSDTKNHDKAFLQVINGIKKLISSHKVHSETENTNRNPNYSEFTESNQDTIDSRSALQFILTNSPEGKANYLILHIGNHIEKYKESLDQLPRNIEDEIGVSDYSSVLDILKKLKSEGLITYEIYKSRKGQEFKNIDLTEAGWKDYQLQFEP